MNRVPTAPGYGAGMHAAHPPTRSHIDGSRFELCTGAVLQGPAVFAQPRIDARERDGKIEVGLPAAGGAELPELATFGDAPSSG